MINEAAEEQYAYHRPIMLQQCLDGLAVAPGGNYADLTFGGGGHSRAIWQACAPGKLYAFDKDADAQANAAAWADERLVFIKADFRYLGRYLKLHGAPLLDGVLADLGISSHQINTPQRGFSTRYDAPLDMRMNQDAGQTAAELINSATVEDLHKILGMYGEVTNARTLAQALYSARLNQPLETTGQLAAICKRHAPRNREFKYMAQVFQAFRIVVNDEMQGLEEMLLQLPQVVKPGGRIAIITFHSLEDRMVKNFIKSGNIMGHLDKDVYGNVSKPFEAVHRKALTASEEELQINSRARSAHLRVAVRL